MKKRFFFEECWVDDSECKQLVDSVWNGVVVTGSVNGILKKIDRCGKVLRSWNIAKRWDQRKELQDKRKALKAACNSEKPQSWKAINVILSQLDELLNTEERSKRKLYADIVDRVWGKIKGWVEKLLSVGGNEILIKAVVQDIPMYSMSLFRLPKGLIQEIQRLTNRFWWGSNAKNRRIHWCAWDHLFKPKHEGGLGFRNLEISNWALLANQCWRLLKNPDSLAAKILKGCYHKNCGFLEAPKKSGASFHWTSLVWGKELLKKGLRWRIGNGSSICIYKDKWIPRPFSLKVLAPPVWELMLKNAKFHGQHDCELSSVGTWCKNYLMEYQTSIRNDNKFSNGGNQLSETWIPPNQDQYKINCCSVFDRGKGRIGVGIITRNSKVEIMASSAQTIEASFSLKMRQLVAIKKSILFGMDCGLASILVEANESSVVLKWLCDGSHKDSENGVILDEIANLMHAGNGIVVSNVSRKPNMPAAVLAKEAPMISEDTFWMEECPPF
ncbi:hypothetical protein Ddye_007789 [Dipteronia dyeriana]|uniref:RNase H type-1 domain-containing protein n=1 Tax=Dipteronia dyeriana TaxID=168575 RepID=A0AAE0CS03_9ROSI|nr:hypothetical protein Ddye_007789 [Dipteronia dyeriana]